MFKLFKKGEPENNKAEAKVEETEKEELVEIPEPQDIAVENLPAPISPEQVFARSIKDVKEYLLVNGEINIETIEKMTGMSLEETLENLEKYEDLKMELSIKEIQGAVTEALITLEEPAQESWLRKFANKPAVKGIFVAVMLFLKFAPEVQSAEKKEMEPINPNHKTEVSFDQSQSIDDANTYQLDSDDLKKINNKDLNDAKDLSSEVVDLERYAQLELSNYYETDSDNISGGNEQEIRSQFTKFLDNINVHNVQEILETDFEIFGSSDERPTNNWGGSNEKLTKARIAAVEKIF